MISGAPAFAGDVTTLCEKVSDVVSDRVFGGVFGGVELAKMSRSVIHCFDVGQAIPELGLGFGHGLEFFPPELPVLLFFGAGSPRVPSNAVGPRGAGPPLGSI